MAEYNTSSDDHKNKRTTKSMYKSIQNSEEELKKDFTELLTQIPNKEIVWQYFQALSS